MIHPDLGSLPAIFPLFGLLLALYYAWGVLDFIWFHYLRPKSYTRLLHGAKPCALITGATDGIGRSTAKELYAKGFNLILHGRNEEKMKQVVEELKAVNPRSELEVEYFIADAGQQDVNFKEIARRFEGLNITLFVNNVGASLLPTPQSYVSSSRSDCTISGSDPWTRIDQLDEDLITKVLNINSRFPLFLTRAFLPSLRRTSQKGPVEVVFIGSFSGDVAVPFVLAYAGSKALIKRVSRILNTEERVLSRSNLSLVYANVGEVQTATMRAATALARPSSDDYATHLVGRFGSGRGVVIPHPVHHIIYALVTGMPEVLCDYIVLAEGMNVYRKMKESAKRG
jgi:17beta-estradiol 17-dehydrogenase / very-long-chain 3-oxoacyl-CoA reductase